MRLPLALCSLVALEAFAADGGAWTPSRWSSLNAEARDNQLERLARLPLNERLLQASAGFLDVPYQVSPLGEGEGKDPDPLIRYDRADCLSLVEQSIAMSLASQPEELETVLARVRYGDHVSYEQRNHLMEADWLPNNIRKGFLRDVTRVYGGDAVREALKVLSARTWSSKTSLALGLPPSRQVQGQFPLQVIPLDKVMEKIRRVPSGTVLVVVREDRPLMPTRVSHLGFVLQQKRPILRHASRTFGRVVDEDLESFLLRNQRYQKWPVVGISLFEVREPQRFAQP